MIFKTLLFFFLGVPVFAVNFELAAMPSDRVIQRWGVQCGEKLKHLRSRAKPYPRDLRRTTETEKQYLRDAFVTCLSSYLQIPTVNPPGNESKGVLFLNSVGKVLGWKINVEALSPGRENWSGRIGPDGSESVVLLHHIDVVDVKPSDWQSPELPFSGRIITTAKVEALKPGDLVPASHETEELWGRGSVDMKSFAILQMITATLLENSEFKPTRKMILLAVADEEVGGSGARKVVGGIQERGPYRDLLKTRVVLNEGGFGVQDAVKKGQHLFVIGSEEKGGVWFKMRAKAPEQLLSALGALKVFNSELAQTGDASSEFASFRHRLNQAGCRALTGAAPSSQINVVASEVKVKFKCSSELSLDDQNPRFGVTQLKASDGLTELTFRNFSTGHGALGSSFQLLNFVMSLISPTLNPYFKPIETPYIRTPATRALIANVASTWLGSFDLNRILDWGQWIEQPAMKILGAKLFSESLFRTSCQWTSWTMTSAESEAWIDCRLISDGLSPNPRTENDGDRFVQRLIALSEFEGVKIETTQSWNVTRSPIEGPIFQIFKDEINGVYARSKVTPYLFPAGSDSRFFREARAFGAEVDSIPSYGFFPFLIGKDIVRTPHSSNERLPLEYLQEAIQTYYRVVGRLVTDPL